MNGMLLRSSLHSALSRSWLRFAISWCCNAFACRLKELAMTSIFLPTHVVTMSRLSDGCTNV